MLLVPVVISAQPHNHNVVNFSYTLKLSFHTVILYSLLYVLVKHTLSTKKRVD